MKNFVVIVILIGLGSIAAGQTPSGDVEKGKQLYVKNGCYQCHGYDGHGGVGPKLAPKPLPAVALIAYIRHPAPGGMPVYSAKVMPDSDVRDVRAYLNSMPAAPAVQDVPLLNGK